MWGFHDRDMNFASILLNMRKCYMDYEIYMQLTMNVAQTSMSETFIFSTNLCVSKSNVYLMESGSYIYSCCIDK